MIRCGIGTVAAASKHRQTCSAKVLAETSMVEWVRIFLCISPGFASVFKSPILIHYDAVPEACICEIFTYMITYLKMNIFIILLLVKINLYLLFYTFVLIIFIFIIKNENL